MSSLPRTTCPTCLRRVAVMPGMGAGQWRAVRHDNKAGHRSDAEGFLISCSASLALVDLDDLDFQLQLPEDADPVQVLELF